LREYEEEILKLEQETLRRGTTSGAVNAIESALSDDGAVLTMMCERFVSVFEGENALRGGRCDSTNARRVASSGTSRGARGVREIVLEGDAGDDAAIVRVVCARDDRGSVR
jgi:hypothetical protein